MDADKFSWKDRKVFLTGASGFVGSGLLARLAREGAVVTALVTPGSRSLRLPASGNVRVAEAFVEDAEAVGKSLREAEADTVFHLAAINTNVGTNVSPLNIFETNICGTWNVLEACRVIPGVERVVLASSREAEVESLALGTPDQPRANRRFRPYQVSKISAELVAQAYCDTFNLPVVISRSDNIYGEGDLNWNRLIPGTCRALLEGKAPVLRSDGSLARDYVYIADMVDAYLSLAARAGNAGIMGEVFHFATGKGTTALEIVSQLCEFAGKPDLKPVVLNESKEERVNEPRDISRAFKLLGWSSGTQMKDGLRQTFDWYRKCLLNQARET